MDAACWIVTTPTYMLYLLKICPPLPHLRAVYWTASSLAPPPPIIASQPHISSSLIDPTLWLLTVSWHMVMWDYLKVNPLNHHSRGELTGSLVRQSDDVIFTNPCIILSEERHRGGAHPQNLSVNHELYKKECSPQQSMCTWPTDKWN